MLHLPKDLLSSDPERERESEIKITMIDFTVHAQSTKEEQREAGRRGYLGYYFNWDLLRIKHVQYVLQVTLHLLKDQVWIFITF